MPPKKRNQSPGKYKNRSSSSNNNNSNRNAGRSKSPGKYRGRSKSPGKFKNRTGGGSSASIKKIDKKSLGYYASLGKQAKAHTCARDAIGADAPAMSLRSSMASMSLGKPLLAGIAVTKISHGGKSSNRILTLALGQSCIFLTHGRVKGDAIPSKLPVPTWTPSKGWKGVYLRYLDVADLGACQFGVVGTQVMEQYFRGGENNKNKGKRDQIVSIFHQDASGRQTLNLLVDKPENLMLLKIAFSVMISNYSDRQQWVSRDAVLFRYVEYDIDKDRNRSISESEFSKLCQRLNFYVSGISKHFKEFLKSEQIKSKELTWTETWKLMKQLQRASNGFKPSPGDVIWKEVFGKVDSVSFKVFHKKFMQGCQGEKNAKEDDARCLIAAINAMEIDEESIPENTLKLYKPRFVEYLRCTWNDAYDPMKQKMPTSSYDKPISHYWINTSHNTYLMGDQLRSKSSVEAYTEALLRGCKCLELDCWDGFEKKGEYFPVIYHGHTLTTKIEFRDVVMVVQQYLKANPETYPIILSLENHCSHPYQMAMATTLNQLLGKLLFKPSTHHRAKELPSPEELKGMAVIKGKRPPEPDEEDGNDSKDDNGGDDDDDDDDSNNPYGDIFAKYGNNAVKPSSDRMSSLVPQSTAVIDTGDKNSKRSKNNPLDDDEKNSKLPKYAPELLEITLFHGTKFKFFEESIDMLTSHMHSIGETNIPKIVTKYENNPSLWREYNTDHMTRTYPAGKRIDSSNYNPVLAWAMGCQMVALNFQTHDANLTLNDGRFRQFGRCGYIPKPSSLLRGGDKAPSKKLSIRIISGSCLPKPNGEKTGEAIDPYVKVELHDVRINNRFREQFYISGKRTKAVDNNGLCPIWNDVGKDFNVENPHVAMVLFQVMDEDVGRDDMIASAAIPVSCLRKGYRSIQLFDHRNTRLGPYMAATLLVHIKMK